MTDLNRGINDIARRRGFLRFGGAITLGLVGLASKRLYAQAEAADDGPNWPGALQGRHRQVVDAYEANGVFRSRSHIRFWSPTNRRQPSSFCVMALSRSHSATRCGES